MKIFVHDPKGNHHIRLWFPNALVFSNFGIRLITQSASQKQELLDPQLLNRFLLETKHILKQYKGLEIVDVQSKDGEIVKIIL